MKTASLICPVYRMDNLDDVLWSIGRQDCAPELYEVLILATNAETGLGELEQKCEQMRQKGVDIRCVDARGQSNCESRNRAAGKARGDVLIFADGDQMFSRNLVRKHLQLVDRDMMGIGLYNINASRAGADVLVEAPSASAKASFIGQDYRQVCAGMNFTSAKELAKMHNRGELTDYINAVTRNLSVWHNTFDLTGGFDLEMGFSQESPSRGWEDVEYGVRVHLMGIFIVFAPCWAIHMEHKRLEKDSGAGNVKYLVNKHPDFFRNRPEWFRLRYNSIFGELERVYNERVGK